MARIRTIKPSLWDSEKLGRLSLLARLTFVGLIALADDEGRGRGSPAYLKGALHTYADAIDASSLSNSIVELHQSKAVIFYEVAGSRYYALPNWGEHQKIDKPRKSAIPEPPIEEPGLFGEDSPTPSRSLAEDSPQEWNGREGITNNNRPERRGPDELQAVVKTAAKKLTATANERAGDYGDYRLPKNFGQYGGAYVANVPADECQFLLDRMKPGPMVAAALRWRIETKKSEGHGESRT